MNPRMTLLSITAVTTGLFASCSSFAEPPAVRELPFVKALTDGQASQDLPEQGPFKAAASYIQQTTGNAGTVTVVSYLIKKFKSQPDCGRIAFGLYQAATKTFWGQLGGQINICASGLPPRRICKVEPTKLVAIDATCADGSPTIDAPEVAEAIAEALKNGGLSADEVHKRIKATTGGTGKTGSAGGSHEK